MMVKRESYQKHGFRRVTVSGGIQKYKQANTVLLTLVPSHFFFLLKHISISNNSMQILTKFRMKTISKITACSFLIRTNAPPLQSAIPVCLLYHHSFNTKSW